MKVELTKDELGIINNALNEVCNGIDLEGEFDTRMGCTVGEARRGNFWRRFTPLHQVNERRLFSPAIPPQHAKLALNQTSASRNDPERTLLHAYELKVETQNGYHTGARCINYCRTSVGC
jgi:hypothetical protein